jgi:DNA-directed RNA polymerase subunit RPC12/RpoP
MESDPAREPREPLVCAECGREPRDDENAAEEWRAYLDINDDLPVFCPECAEREFRLAGSSRL